jgi:hypothetical protein
MSYALKLSRVLFLWAILCAPDGLQADERDALDRKVQPVIDEVDKLCRENTVYMIGPEKAKRLAQLDDLAADIGETKNLYDAHSEVVAKMTALMEQLVSLGRSTPGRAQKRDVDMNWNGFSHQRRPNHLAASRKGSR